MEKTELYEKVRVILGTGPNEIATGNAFALPRHPATFKMLNNLFSEKEARIIVDGFQQAGKAMTLDEIASPAGIPLTELKGILDDMCTKGKLVRNRTHYMVIPLYPGGFEVYFTRDKDDPEKRKNVAEAHFDLIKEGLIQEISAGNYSRFRVIPSYEPTIKTIELNQSVENEKTVLPFEVLKEHILNMKTDQFAVIPCPDRTAAKLAGRPCQRTDENFCIATGPHVRGIVKQGIGRRVSLEELLQLLEKAEHEGLVHQTTNIQDSALFLCNCCPCCCPYLISFKKFGRKGATAKTNFDPVIDPDSCTLCEECSRVCPMEAIYHHHPHREDGSDDYMFINLDHCLGCGVCASNCPSGSISLKKVREDLPVQTHIDLLDRVKAGLRH